MTYPVYVDGKPRCDLGPKVRTMCGWNYKDKPIIIHYNGHNHYNAIVPIRPSINLTCSVTTLEAYEPETE